jgi:hypothetical protein
MGVSEPKHFVLVHGGGLGAWCWYKVIDLLRKKGHKATAKDQTDPNAVTSFVEYNQPLVDFFETLSGNEKVSMTLSNAIFLSLFALTCYETIDASLHISTYEVAVQKHISTWM